MEICFIGQHVLEAYECLNRRRSKEYFWHESASKHFDQEFDCHMSISSNLNDEHTSGLLGFLISWQYSFPLSIEACKTHCFSLFHNYPCIILIISVYTVWNLRQSNDLLQLSIERSSHVQCLLLSNVYEFPVITLDHIQTHVQSQMLIFPLTSQIINFQNDLGVIFISVSPQRFSILKIFQKIFANTLLNTMFVQSNDFNKTCRCHQWQKSEFWRR